MARSKYGNTPTTLDGRTFASKGESQRYAQLKIYQAANLITGLVCQPKIELPVKGYASKRNIECQPDFSYINRATGRVVFEDFKGGKATQTDVFKIKAALVMHFFSIKINVVTKYDAPPFES